MLRNLFRHVFYILINIIVIAILIQVAIAATRTAFEFGRDFMIEQLENQPLDVENEYVLPEALEE